MATQTAEMTTTKTFKSILRGMSALSDKERFTHNDIVGIWKSPDGKVSAQTCNGIIHYSPKKGVHVVPAQP